MKELKYSRQRDALLSSLKTRYDHPTADMLYTDLKKEYPRISLGTVYRNLALLTETGDILKISCGDGIERYDGQVKEHSHFICRCCGRVIDMDSKKQIREIKHPEIEKIESYSLMFYGLCKECSRKKG